MKSFDSRGLKKVQDDEKKRKDQEKDSLMFPDSKSIKHQRKYILSCILGTEPILHRMIAISVRKKKTFATVCIASKDKASEAFQLENHFGP